MEERDENEINKIEFGNLNYDEIREMSLGSIIYAKKIKGHTENAKEDNDECYLIIRKGISKDKKYEWYPYWGLAIRGENGNLITWTKTRNLLERKIISGSPYLKK